MVTFSIFDDQIDHPLKSVTKRGHPIYSSTQTHTNTHIYIYTYIWVKQENIIKGDANRAPQGYRRKGCPIYIYIYRWYTKSLKTSIY